jgi:hypothetical protein
VHGGGWIKGFEFHCEPLALHQRSESLRDHGEILFYSTLLFDISNPFPSKESLLLFAVSFLYRRVADTHLESGYRLCEVRRARISLAALGLWKLRSGRFARELDVLEL